MKNAALKQYKKKKNYKLLLWLLPFLVFVVLFSYVPLFGWSIAFFQYTPGSSLSAENFVGLKYFRQFFMDTVDMWRVIKNTLIFAVLGLVTMVLFKPRSWCVYCPMGTMTQLICKARSGKG